MRRESMKDIDFLSNVIATICDYAVQNGMEPDETLKAIANMILSMLKISTYNGWKVGQPHE